MWATSLSRVLGVRDVGGYGDRLLSERSDFCGGCFEGLGSPAGYGDVGAIFGQHQRRTMSYARSTSGDEGNPALEGESIRHRTAPPLTPMTWPVT